MAKKLAADEFNAFNNQKKLSIDEKEETLPFENLDENIIVADALLVEWPAADAIIGNPPYQSKNKMQEEFGPAYVKKIRATFPEVPGRSDYCVYWFRKAHDNLKEGGRAGMVGTNTIRQNYSREGGLDYITSHKGIITDAVSSMPWSGEAAVHVSIVNWRKGRLEETETHQLLFKKGTSKDSSFEIHKVDRIPSSLTLKTDLTKAKKLNENKESKLCYQGQTHGHAGFLLSDKERREMITEDPNCKEVIFPYLTAEDLVGTKNSHPTRFVIDFGTRVIYEAKKYSKAFTRVERIVLPQRREAYEKENKRNESVLNADPNSPINKHHKNFFQRWWLLSYGREELIDQISKLGRYLVCGQVTTYPIFEFVSSSIRPNAALIVFPMEDDYSFGILQSDLHWEWFKERCSTLGEGFRYTSTTVFETYPWPQWGKTEVEKTNTIGNPLQFVKEVADAAKRLRTIRNKIREETNMPLREIYRTLELPGNNELKDAHEKLNAAVLSAYVWGLPSKYRKMKYLELLLSLNQKCASIEEAGKRIQGPGLPKFAKAEGRFISDDCIRFVK